MSAPKGHRATLGAYIRAGHHMLGEHKAKTIRQIAVETGMSTTTARHWLKADLYDVWLEWWPSADALWAEMSKHRAPSSTMSFDLPDFDPASDDLR